jgi:hypothetical protein
MQAVTDFAATREHIRYAISVFNDGYVDLCEKEVIARENWIAVQADKDFFRRSVEYWTKRANGKIGDFFEQYQMRRAFRQENQDWFQDKLEKASELLRKFDCAVDNCEAVEVKLSDKDLELLSISLQSALRN